MSCGILPTPTNPVFFAENIEGVKEGCEGDVKSEILAGEDWARAGSPPLTPGKEKFFTSSFVCRTQNMLVRGVALPIRVKVDATGELNSKR